MRSSKAIFDTVALKICKDDFKITKPDLFNPNDNNKGETKSRYKIEFN